jgi:hypothetical protein
VIFNFFRRGKRDEKLEQSLQKTRRGVFKQVIELFQRSEIDEDFFDDLEGDDTLGDSDTFKEAWDAAGAPDKVSAAFYADVPSLVRMAHEGEFMSSEERDMLEPFGPWVGWTTAEDDSASFNLFMAVDND